MERGTNNVQADRPSGVLFAAGRMVGYVLLAGMALAIMGAIVIIPPYTEMVVARYELGCLQASVQDAQDLVSANERLLAALPEDEVLITRLAMTQEPLLPGNHEVVRVPTQLDPIRPDLVRPGRNPRPAPPSGLLFQINARLANPGTKRGLFLLASALLGVALFLFAPPNRYRRGRSPQQNVQ